MMEYFLVGEVSEILKIPKSTLRYYDRKGIISPTFRKENNYRCYSKSQLITLKKINMLRKLGFTLEEIKVFFNEHRKIQKDDKILVESVLERINEDIDKLIGIKIDLEKHLKKIEKHLKVTIGVPFIEDIEEIKGIKVYEKEKRDTFIFHNPKILNILERFDDKIVFYITKKKLEEMEDYNILGQGYVSVKEEKENKELILKKGKYACIFLKESYLEKKSSIDKLTNWIEEKHFKKINNDVNIIIELGNLSVKKKEDILYKISILVKEV